MGLKFEEKKGALIIEISDKLDSLNAKEIYDKIEERLKNCDKDVVFDFENLDYISSAGLQILISAAKNRKSVGKDVYIYKPNSMVDSVINVAGFYSFLKKAQQI